MPQLNQRRQQQRDRRWHFGTGSNALALAQRERIRKQHHNSYGRMNSVKHNMMQEMQH